MKKLWTDEAWDDYLWWQENDRKKLKRINKLIKDIERNGNMQGIGKPEALMYALDGFFSRRIDSTHRLIYVADDDKLTIISCRYHYADRK